MGLFSFFKRKKNKDNTSTNIPKASYDLYNNGETQNINSYENSNLLVAYEETVAKNESEKIDDLQALDNAETVETPIADTEVQQETPQVDASEQVNSELESNPIEPAVENAPMDEAPAETVATEEQPAEAANLTETSEEKEMAQTKTTAYYISVKKDKSGKKLGWEVKKGRNPEKLCANKEEALSYVKSVVEQENQEATCVIRKTDGSVQEKLKFNKK